MTNQPQTKIKKENKMEQKKVEFGRCYSCNSWIKPMLEDLRHDKDGNPICYECYIDPEGLRRKQREKDLKQLQAEHTAKIKKETEEAWEAQKAGKELTVWQKTLLEGSDKEGSFKASLQSKKENKVTKKYYQIKGIEQLIPHYGGKIKDLKPNEIVGRVVSPIANYKEPCSCCHKFLVKGSKVLRTVQRRDPSNNTYNTPMYCPDCYQVKELDPQEQKLVEAIWGN